MDGHRTLRSWLHATSILILVLLSTRAAGASPPGGAPRSTRAVLVGCRPWALAQTAVVVDPGDSRGDRDEGGPIPDLPRPDYLRPVRYPGSDATIERISGDTGEPIASIHGTWGADARHHYAKTQPWNSDGTLLVIENRKGSPSHLLLDGDSYEPRGALCDQAWDFRWHPSPEHPHEIIDVNREGTELRWIDVTDCRENRSWRLPVKVDGFGGGEGNPSLDGRFVALGNDHGVFVVDMDPPHGHGRIGPVYEFPPCSLVAGRPNDCAVDNLSISPSGRYVVVKYGEGKGVTVVDSTEDATRVYEVDPATLELRPHEMAASSPRCGSFAARPDGWTFPLKHSDLARNPFDEGEDVLIGGRSCPGSKLAHTLMVRLRDGRVTELTDPSGEAPFYHTSCQALDRPGWVYVDYFKAEGRRYSDEILAVKMDGSRTIEHVCHTHTQAKGCYRCEAHPVPSRDGRRVLFASNWMEDCDRGCGPATDIKDYVVRGWASRDSDRDDRRGKGH